MNDLHVFLGVRGMVLCISTETGAVVWQSDLGGVGFGEGFVSIALDSKRVFAHTRGRLHCLERGTGAILWTNELPGMGYGTAFVCTDASPMQYAEAVLKHENARKAGS